MRRFDVFSVAAVLALAAGCSDSAEDGPASAQIAAFSLTPSGEVEAGSTVEITWATTGAVSVNIAQDPGGVIVEEGAASGTETSKAINFNDTKFTLTAVGEDGNAVEQTLSIDVTGITIVRFAAVPDQVPDPQNPDQRVDGFRLEYEIGGGRPSSVTISENGVGIAGVNPTASSGRVNVVPEADATYVLLVTGASDEATSTIEMDVPPVIVSFGAFRGEDSVTKVAEGTRPNIRWQTARAEDVEILVNGGPGRNWSPNQAAFGRWTAPVVMSGQTTYTLRARNGDEPDDIVEQSVTVETGVAPTVTLDLTPQAFTTPVATITASWTTTNADSIELSVAGTVVENASSLLNGTYEFTVTEETEVKVVASNQVADEEATATVAFSYDDDEPNNTLATATLITADGGSIRGTLQTADDVDVYQVAVSEGQSLFAQTSQPDDDDCLNFGATIKLLDEAGTELGIKPSNGCTSIVPPENAGFAENLAAGNYYIQIEAGPNSAGEAYALRTQTARPGPAVPGLTKEAFPNPQAPPLAWDISDFVEFTVNVGVDRSLNFARGLLSPRHGVQDVGLLLYGLRSFPAVSDYSQELNLMTALAGLTNQSAFTEAEFSRPNLVAGGFTVVPTGQVLGRSSDSAEGPIIPNSVLTIEASFFLLEDGEVSGPVGSFRVTRDTTMGIDGISHISMMWTLQLQDFNNPPPIDDTVNLAVFAVLQDQNEEGYNVTFPLTLSP